MRTSFLVVTFFRLVLLYFFSEILVQCLLDVPGALSRALLTFVCRLFYIY